MGAAFDSRTFGGELSRAEVQKQFWAEVEEAKHEYGHRGYTGTIAECSEEIKFRNVTYATYDEAYQWLDENCEKWEAPRGVLYMEGDKKMWLIGACVSC